LLVLSRTERGDPVLDEFSVHVGFLSLDKRAQNHDARNERRCNGDNGE
jgi:hypothetical protein